MFIKLSNCLEYEEYEDNRYNFGDVEYFIPIKEIKKMRTYKEITNRFCEQDETYYCLEILVGSVDAEWDCYYFQTKEERDAITEQIITHPVFVESFNK